jgi:hypothetical protein
MSDPFESGDKNWKDTEVSQGSYDKLPAGDYHMQIEDVSVAQSSHKKVWQVVWKMVVVSPDSKGRKHWMRTPLEGQYLSITKNTVWACGLNPETMADLKKMIQMESFNGITVEVKITEKDQTFVNKVVETQAEEAPTAKAVPEATEIEKKAKPPKTEKPSTEAASPAVTDEDVPW